MGGPSGAPPALRVAGLAADLTDDGVLDPVQVLGDVRLAGDADAVRAARPSPPDPPFARRPTRS